MTTNLEILGTHSCPRQSRIKPLACAAIVAAFTGTAAAQITLSGTSYLQDFDLVGSGLPAGWSVTTTTTSSDLGDSASFQSAATSWSASLSSEPLNFRNIASDNISSAANTLTQAADSDRALGWRPGGAASRNGAVTFAVANTTGFTDFSVSVVLFSSNNVSLDQTYAFEYRVGNSGNFTQIGSTYTTGTVFGTTTISAPAITLAALNDQNNPVYFRIRGTTSSGTSSSGLDVLGVESFSLNYSSTAVPEPTTYAVIFGAIALGTAAVYRRRRTVKLLARAGN